MKNYSKALNGDVYGTSTGPSCGRLGDQMMRRIRDVPRIFVKHVFQIQLTNI